MGMRSLTKTRSSEEAHGPVSQRSPAPGRLAVVQSFLNSVDYEEGVERFGSSEDIQIWMVTHELIDGEHQLSAADRDRVIELREALRDLVGANTGEHLWEGANERFAEAIGSGVFLTPASNGAGQVDLIPADSGTGLDAAFARLLLICHDARLDGTWARFKLCRNQNCRWAFYDTSRNRSGIWCDMATCGSRHKARAYRLRKQAGAS